MIQGFDFVEKAIQESEQIEKQLKRKRKVMKLKTKVAQMPIKIFPIQHIPLNCPLYINGLQYPMLVTITKKCFFRNNQENDNGMSFLPKAVQKFYQYRNFLFEKYEDGIQLDEESWYSVIPEVYLKNYLIPIYKVLSNFKNSDKYRIIDGFCGSGGLAIQLAQKFSDLVAIDIDPIKVGNINNNMVIYGQHFQVMQMSFFDYEDNAGKPKIVIMAPPWGGLKYIKKQEYDMEQFMNPSLYDILVKAFSLSDKLVLQLPKNINLKQLVRIFQQVQEKNQLKLKRFNVEIEQIYLMVYFGDLATPQYSVELQKLYEQVSKEQVKQLGVLECYKQLRIEDQIMLIENKKEKKKKKRIKKKEKEEEKKKAVLIKYDDI